MGLSENTVPSNPILNHNFSYHNCSFGYVLGMFGYVLGYPPFPPISDTAIFV